MLSLRLTLNPDTFSLDLCLGGGCSGITGGEYHSPTIQTPKTSSDSRLRSRPREGLSVSRWIYGLGGLVRVLQGCMHFQQHSLKSMRDLVKCLQ